ncbi:MAG: hypothetical protein IPK83_05645 [Planctomycetes bacterium]|nr:hypothetical protein [Planctomycetota bacterium]
MAVGTTMAQTGAPAKPKETAEVALTQQRPATAAETAIQRAADANKYIFLFFFRATDDATKVARTTLDAELLKLADRATTTAVNISDAQEKELVKKYGLDRAPMPLVLAVSPLGAVTRSFPGKFTEADLLTAFVSVGMEKCLKGLQDRKIVTICVQNEETEQNAGAMKGVNELVTDKEFAGTIQIVTIDPADKNELSLLKQFKVDPKTKVAETVLLAPPGTVVGNFVGDTTKEVLVAAVKSAAKGCDPKSGCCPPKAPTAGAPAPKTDVVENKS